MPSSPYADRRDAGRVLAATLAGSADVTLAGSADVTPAGSADAGALVLGLPRGGVVVAAEVAAALGAQLDVLVVRKLGAPGHPELAMGAIAAIGDAVETVWVRRVLDRLAPDEADIDAVRDREIAELRRRAAAYRGDRPAPALAGRHVLLVDDGLATGATMRVAVHAVRASRPARLTVAVPVGPPEVVAELAAVVDALVCPEVPVDFHSVGQAYADFAETSDAEVVDALVRGGTVG